MEGKSVEAEIRAEMDEVTARLRLLPVESFAERTALRDRQAQLRNLLAQFDDPRTRRGGFPAAGDGHPELSF